MTQKELGYVELEWTCKHCGTINPGLARVCSNCGAPIAVDDKLELPDQQELITDKEKLEEAKKGPAIQCPYCNVLNPAGTKLCIQCGGDIQAGLARKAGEVLGAFETAPVPDKPCPFCGQPVKANAQRCPHCGGSLVEAAKPAAIPTAVPKRTSMWLIIGGIFLGVLCLGSLIAYLVMSSRTSNVIASVSNLSWQLSVDILEKQPVKKSDWSENVPSQAQNVECQDKYKETSGNPVPNATEVCGTPYTIDTGSGAGKVVQDCEYQVYASYCNFSVLDWTVVNSASAQGSDNHPQWPVTNLQAGQQEGDRHEAYQVTFAADGQTYAYTPVDMAEFSQFDLDSQWTLSINSFNQIKDIQRK
jgi:DNA-directed RNA polymerase subunit RPC12/RpoP